MAVVTKDLMGGESASWAPDTVQLTSFPATFPKSLPAMFLSACLPERSSGRKVASKYGREEEKSSSSRETEKGKTKLGYSDTPQ